MDDCISRYCNNNVCCTSPGQDDRCCQNESGCNIPNQICSAEFTCRPCDADAQCSTQYPSTPRCDEPNGVCVECLENAHCRDATAPFQSPLGICTPQNICTCYVETETWGCSQQSECPSGFVCAEDTIHVMQTNIDHYVCLRPCDNDQYLVDGIACESRKIPSQNSTLVWAPMTTCYAFEQFGRSCSAENDICNVVTPASEMIPADGICSYDKCVYRCVQDGDHWCPSDASCKLFNTIYFCAH